MTDAGVLDEAFERFARTGPEFGRGLSNHGPMGSEALVALGRPDVVPGWSEWYAPRLQEQVRPARSIGAGDWREALGRIDRVADWVVLFERELEMEPWSAVVERWAECLAPGVMATHGLLRTAHAVRALDGGETFARRHELAEGLAYWAARYQPLAGRHTHDGKLRVAEALPMVERLGPDGDRRGLFKDVIVQVETSTDFEGVVDLVSPAVPVDEFISDLTRVFVREYLENAPVASIAFIHTVTAPSALRFIGPHVTDRTARSLNLYMWQACAAMHAAFARGRSHIEEFAPAPYDEDDLIAQVIDARDEHAIKFAEACLREHRLTGDATFIAAIQDVVRRIRA